MNTLKTLAAIAILAAVTITYGIVNAKAEGTQTFYKQRSSGEWSTAGVAASAEGNLIAMCGIYTKIGEDSMFAVNAIVSDILTPNKVPRIQYSITWPKLSKNAGGAVRVVAQYTINGKVHQFEDMWNRDPGVVDGFTLKIPYAVVTELFRKASTLKFKFYTKKNSKDHYYVTLNMQGTDDNADFQIECANKFAKIMKVEQ